MTTQAIVTKYHGPTNTRGARISATAQAGRLYYPYRYELPRERNHAAAAYQYAKFRKWAGEYYSGGLPGDDNAIVWCYRSPRSASAYDCFFFSVA